MSDPRINALLRDVKLLQEKTEMQENEIGELKKKVTALINKVGN